MLYWLLPDLPASEFGKELIESAIDDAIRAKDCFKFKMLVNPRVSSSDEELAAIGGADAIFGWGK